MYAVIPDRDVIRFPSVTYMESVVLCDLSKEEGEGRVGLCLGNAYYSPCEAWRRRERG